MNQDKPVVLQHAPKINIKKERKISPLWILPILALCLAGWLGYKAYTETGDSIQIRFSDAQGLVEGRTTIRYQGLEVGIVKKVRLAQNLSDIYVDADIYPNATKLLSEHTRFWLVKPSATIEGITGLDALVSGNYIALQPADNMAEESEDFIPEYVALDSEPADIRSANGVTYTLRSSDLASVSVGSQILFRKIPIGKVTNYQLSEDASSVQIQVSIKKEYAHLINSDSRFWNVSGIGAKVGFDGVDVQLESLNSLLVGGIAVDSPTGGESVEPGTSFHLYSDLKTAGRGVRISIELPDNSEINSNSPIMYRGIEIGQVTSIRLSKKTNTIMAQAAIEPAFADKLTSGTKFMLEEAQLSLSNMKNLSNLFRGNFLTIVPGEGTEARDFVALRDNELSQSTARASKITLTADNTYGLEAGAVVTYRGINVGAVTSVALDGEKIRFDLLIDNKYKHLIKSENRFYVAGTISAGFVNGNLDVSVPPAKQLLAGSISFESHGEPSSRNEYHLYKSASQSQLAKYEAQGSKKFTLISPKLPGLSKGSPVLYHNIEVGKVADYQLQNDGQVEIAVRIENRYLNLITKDTVFWNRSGVKVAASITGIQVEADPISTLIKGGIAFDNISGVINKVDGKWRLYESFKQASEFGRLIHLTMKDNANVSAGMAIKYQGVNVGEVISVKPDFVKEGVNIQARIFPQYISSVVRSGSYFWVVSPSIGLNGAKNLDSIINPYIQVKPSKSSQSASQFVLNPVAPINSGKIFYLQSLSKNSIKPGTPVLYRGFEVGQVRDVALSRLSDRVINTIQIQPEFAHLVRQNTVFWNTSGVNVSIGLTGADVKAGTVDSIIRGGISFATPDEGGLKTKAPAKKTFFLYDEAQPDWLTWQTPIPK
ncbi:MAG: MlaD family protein [Vibrio sp.]